MATSKKYPDFQLIERLVSATRNSTEQAWRQSMRELKDNMKEQMKDLRALQVFKKVNYFHQKRVF